MNNLILSPLKKQITLKNKKILCILINIDLKLGAY